MALSSFCQIFVYFLSSLYTAGHRPNHERGSVLGVAADKDILWIIRMLRFQESHCQQTEFCLNDFRLTLLHHDGTATVGVGFPVDFLNLDTSQFAVFAKEFEGIDIPTAGTSLFVR